MEGGTDEKAAGSMDGWMDRWMDGWMDGWKDGSRYLAEVSTGCSLHPTVCMTWQLVSH